MASYLCKLFYLGNTYFGSQVQLGLRTIQGELIDAMNRWSGESHSPSSVQLGGRTDQGVHSIGQLVMIRTTKALDLDAINSHLPADITIWASCQVSDDFRPRFDVLMRHYRYYLDTTGTELDLPRMQSCAANLAGTHDFSRLSKRDGTRPTTTTILNVAVSQSDTTIIIDVYGTSFLWKLVRKIATLLSSIGTGEVPPDMSMQLLDTEKTMPGGIRPAPAECLILMETVVPFVFYPSKYAMRRIRKAVNARLSLIARITPTLHSIDSFFYRQ